MIIFNSSHRKIRQTNSSHHNDSDHVKIGKNVQKSTLLIIRMYLHYDVLPDHELFRRLIYAFQSGMLERINSGYRPY